MLILSSCLVFSTTQGILFSTGPEMNSSPIELRMSKSGIDGGKERKLQFFKSVCLSMS